jgi:hypothetical protein
MPDSISIEAGKSFFLVSSACALNCQACFIFYSSLIIIMCTVFEVSNRPYIKGLFIVQLLMFFLPFTSHSMDEILSILSLLSSGEHKCTYAIEKKRADMKGY